MGTVRAKCQNNRCGDGNSLKALGEEEAWAGSAHNEYGA